MARLKKLRDIIAELKASNFDLGQLPVTSDLRKYDEWLSDPTKRERTAGSVPDSGKKEKIGIKGFGYPDTNDKILVKIGQRAKQKADGLTDKILFGHAASLTDYAGRAGFIPAKVILGTKLGSAVAKTSDITGNKYKSATGATYTIPFGKNGTNGFEIEAQDAILASTSLSGGYSITFTPEKVRRI